MQGSILILARERHDEELVRVFQRHAGPRWQVRPFPAFTRLLKAAEEGDRIHLIVLPAVGPRLARQIARVLSVSPEAVVVASASQGNVSSAAEAIRAGAGDFLVVGESLAERVGTLLGKQQRLIETMERNRRLGEQNADLRARLDGRFEMIGDSPVMRRLKEQTRRVAPVPRPVLIVGERGTGKELVARAIHHLAGGPARPLVTVNCAALGDALLESELFGYEKGAFTGADETRRGKFELADGGTLFLDEIGNMSLPFQQKILRAVEYGVFTRVGGLAEISARPRILAATNCDLPAMIESGRFLADLYDRLAFEVLQVPPLRERGADLELLARHLLDRFARETPALAGKVISRAAMDALRRHPFAGNVRELKNIIERAAFRDTTDEITPEDLSPLSAGPSAAEGTFKDKVNAYRRQLLSEALASTHGNQAAAARELGLTYDQLRHYLKSLGDARYRHSM